MDGMGIKQCLREYGSYASTVEGMSMYPMLCPHRDTIFIVAADRELSVFDVVLYHTPDGKYILHRILKIQDGHYMICGDNCVNLEYIPREWIIGKLISFYKGEKKMELTNWNYRLYVLLWCRPWHMRIFLLKTRHFLGRIRSRSHGHK